LKIYAQQWITMFIYIFNVNQFFVGFIAILCLFSSNLNKVTSIYKIPCFHPFKVQDSKLDVPKLTSHDGDTMQLQLNLLNDLQILFLMSLEQHSALSTTWWCWWTLQKSKCWRWWQWIVICEYKRWILLWTTKHCYKWKKQKDATIMETFSFWM
jgi:hypothetical protein